MVSEIINKQTRQWHGKRQGYVLHWYFHNEEYITDDIYKPSGNKIVCFASILSYSHSAHVIAIQRTVIDQTSWFFRIHSRNRDLTPLAVIPVNSSDQLDLLE